MGRGLGAGRVIGMWDVSGGLGVCVGWVDGVWDVSGAWGVVRVRARPGVVANGGPRQWRMTGVMWAGVVASGGCAGRVRYVREGPAARRVAVGPGVCGAAVGHSTRQSASLSAARVRAWSAWGACGMGCVQVRRQGSKRGWGCIVAGRVHVRQN